MIERDLVEIIRLAIDEAREQIHTSLPGIVQTFYPSTQTADIQLAVSRPRVDENTGLKTYETLPVLPQVPITYPQGGGFVVAFPLSEGDEVTVLFRMYSDSDWKSTGQTSDPTDATTHGLYCVAIPCVTQEALALTDPVATDLIVGRAGHSEQIRIPKVGGEIDLGAVPTSFVALSTPNDANWTALNTLVTALSAYATAIQAVADPTNAATPVLVAAINAFKAAVLATAATLVKAQ